MADVILCAGQAWLKNKVGFSARRNNNFLQGTLSSLKRVIPAQWALKLYLTTGCIRRSGEILRAEMGKNKKIVALQKERVSGWAMAERNCGHRRSWQWEFSVSLCFQVGKTCLGGGAQADPGSAKTEGKEKRRDPFLIMPLDYQILSSAQPVF